MKFNYILAIILCCSQIIWPAAARPHPHTPSCKIVTSFSILQDLVTNIVGQRCTVESIVGPNEDAHVFEPKPSTNTLLSDADVIIINGLGFEGWMERLLKAINFQGPIVIAAARVTPIYVHMPNNAQPVPDPHAWHTIANAIAYIEEITLRLREIFPQYESEFQHNAHVYEQKLKLLDEDIHKKLATLPNAKRRVITAHDAFGYLSRYYNIKFMSPLGISTDSDPSAKHVAYLIDQIRDTDIKAIFIENITNDKLINQLISETGIKISGKLYSDALSPVNEPASTYIKMMKHNMYELIKAMAHNSE